MRINNILKTLVTVAVVGVAGASIYNHFKKENKETTKTTNPEETKIDDIEVIENEETSTAIDVAEIKNFVTNGLKNRAVVISVIAGVSVVYIAGTIIKRKLHIKHEMTEYMNLLNALDEYLTSHMASTLDPETYAFYCNDKLSSNMYYACCFAKILESDMMSSEQIKAVADTVGNELNM